jgi:hypothetical protein
MKILVWEGDDEFPSSAKMLYDETVVFSFSAEDVAVAGDILIARLKRMRARLDAGGAPDTGGEVAR